MRIQLTLGLLASVVSAVQGQDPAASAGSRDSSRMVLHPLTELQWTEGPASMPKGAKMVILEGDPTQPGMFTLRLKFPDGFRVSPHYHTQTEHVTVMQGVLHIGMGEKVDPKATRALSAGAFGYWQAGMRHFAWFEGETVLQLHGQGPWTVTYVNPTDDPRKQTP